MDRGSHGPVSGLLSSLTPSLTKVSTAPFDSDNSLVDQDNIRNASTNRLGDDTSTNYYIIITAVVIVVVAITNPHIQL